MGLQPGRYRPGCGQPRLRGQRPARPAASLNSTPPPHWKIRATSWISLYYVPATPRQERYRSGHNGADSKSDGRASRHVGSNPTLSAKFHFRLFVCYNALKQKYQSVILSTMNMGYEIDYLPVGDGERSGDAIALRFGNLFGQRKEQFVIVIDGGFLKSGEELVNHIDRYYNTNQVDLVVSTHPDSDHASGLRTVLEKLYVRELAMHLPWKHTDDIENLFKDNRITASGLEKRLEESLQHARDLEKLAIEKGIPIVEPFQGTTRFNGAIHILGPSQDYYKTLLTDFRSMPEPKSSLGISKPLQMITEEAVKWLKDFWSIDLLDDDEDTTSAENNTSTIILFNLDNHKLLFTGDAGKTALIKAIAYADRLGISLVQMQFLDVPHHGSKRNLNSKILKRMNATIAFISANGNNRKHPAKKVTNALQKHGAKVFVNRKSTLWQRFNAIERGWSPVSPEKFHDDVEE